MSNVPPVALTIAGSDSGGGAGIQADLRTFSFHQVHGTSALTCVTAQNTTGVTRVDALPPEAVIAQIEAVTNDIGVQAAKTGMLLNQSIIEAVAAHLTANPIASLVVDPVMVSRTGDKLIDGGAIAALTSQLLPLATILTPNRYEAQILADMTIDTLEDMKQAAQNILELGPKAVIVKGGGFTDELRGIDVWCAAEADGQPNCVALKTELVETTNTHGTGCTLSSAIAANLAKEMSPLEAVTAAKTYVTEALKHSLPIGKGQGPVGHFYQLLDA
ncbi:MAG: bifunctional hydroxymethylpyrimidine kinase/phosphomethylpyrimidine kinase [Cyanobacteria bacterium P01_D01_bin.36]